MQWNQLGVLGIGIDYQYDLAADPVVVVVEAAAQHRPLYLELRKNIQCQRGLSLPVHNTAPTPEHSDQSM
jgi:hypothetical protein